VGAPATPYFLAYDDPATPGTSNLLEIPVSAALNRRVPAVIERACGRVPWPGTRSLLERLGLARVQVLRPFSATLADMCALARRMKRDGVPVVNLVLNSSEAALGDNAGARPPQELERLLSRLETSWPTPSTTSARFRSPLGVPRAVLRRPRCTVILTHVAAGPRSLLAVFH